MQQVAIIVFLGLFGFVNCFFGYCAFKALLPLWGLLLGFFYGFTVVQQFAPDSAVIAVVAGILLGAAGAVLFSNLYFFAVFMLGSAFTGMTAQTLLSLDGTEWDYVIIIGIGLVGGFAALLAQKLLVILATSFAGAAALLSSLLAMLDYEPVAYYFVDPEVLGEFFLPALGGVFAVSLVGITVQVLATSSLRKPRVSR